MDDLLLFIPSKETHMSKLGDLLKALLKNGVENITKEVSNYLRPAYNTWKMKYLLKIRRYV